jgi:hypothetical protein
MVDTLTTRWGGPDQSLFPTVAPSSPCCVPCRWRLTVGRVSLKGSVSRDFLFYLKTKSVLFI